MSPEKQRIVIAEECGWPLRDTMPDYLNDLNAMREAICTRLKMFDDGDRFLEILRQIVAPDYEPGELIAAWSMVNATAKQLAQAFLRTINKWEEGE